MPAHASVRASAAAEGPGRRRGSSQAPEPGRPDSGHEHGPPRDRPGRCRLAARPQCWWGTGRVSASSCHRQGRGRTPKAYRPDPAFRSWSRVRTRDRVRDTRHGRGLAESGCCTTAAGRTSWIATAVGPGGCAARRLPSRARWVGPGFWMGCGTGWGSMPPYASRGCSGWTIAEATGSSGASRTPSVRPKEASCDWRAEEGQHGEYSPVGAGICLESQLPEDLFGMGLDRPLVDKEPVGDGQVREPSAARARTSPLGPWGGSGGRSSWLEFRRRPPRHECNSAPTGWRGDEPAGRATLDRQLRPRRCRARVGTRPCCGNLACGVC